MTQAENRENGSTHIDPPWKTKTCQHVTQLQNRPLALSPAHARMAGVPNRMLQTANCE